MALFQSSVLKNQLRMQDEQQVNTAYKKFTDFFHNPDIQENIRSSKEEQFQATFLNELFVKVLGYTMNPQPNYNLTTEFKNQKNARKADGAILKEGNAVGVIELKGTNTKHLEGIRQQAFDYKANHKGCVYVITSNFEKVRFYINDATEFVEFDLFELNREEFSLLWLCLHRENLLSGKPQKIKEASVVEEEVITKQFYKDYSVFKRELYRDLVKRNAKKLKSLRKNYAKAETSDEQDAQAQTEMANLEKNVKQNLFKKSQKLIDRFLFIFFAEDRALLPPNSIHKILSDWNKLQDLDAEMPLYDRFKLYFSYLDSGRKGTDKKGEIFAYNGGLFKPDPVLDMLEIDDELLYKNTSRLATYDFESQVDVNILGHIFENSLNEIESVNAEIEGASFDKQKSKRKKDGVFYTPKYITKYIVENTVGRLCEEKKSELGFREEEYFRGRKRRQKDTLEVLIKILEDYREWLLQITICDPACGSGAFLNQALDFLIKEHRYVDEMKAKLLGGGLILSDIENTILERNIYGVDINEESVEIAKLSLWLRTAQPRRKLNDLSNSIKCGNSLIDDKKVAGNKAFKWEEEFPEVFAKGGFDVVIGNPPYVRAELLTIYSQYFSANFKVYDSASDLFAYFYELGQRLLRKNGLLGYISNTFDKTKAGKVLRNFLTRRTNFYKYVDFTEVQIFEGATTYPIILLLENDLQKDNHFEYIRIPKETKEKVINIDTYQKVAVSQDMLEDDVWSFFPVELARLLKKISKEKNIKQRYGKCFYGLKTALNDAFIIKSNWLTSEHIKPIYEGKDIKKWKTPEPDKKVILFKSKWTKEKYGDNLKDNDYAEKVKSDFPEIFDHLETFQARARKRYDQGDFWWELRNCAYYDLFEKSKIIFPNLQNHNKFCWDEGRNYINAPAVFLPTESKALLCILNSKLVWQFLKSICVVRSGGYIEVKPQYFEQIPVPVVEKEDQFREKADKVFFLVQDLQHIRNQFVKYFSSSRSILKLQLKLQSWHELEFGDFIKELNKAIKTSNKVRAKEAAVLAGENDDSLTVVEVPTLTKKDEFEWMELFEENKQKAQELQREIEKTEKEIDTMVYELYGLTDEEIRMVEDSIK